MRIFIAIEIPDAIKKAILRQQDILSNLLPQVRFIEASSWHITLAFIGEITCSQLQQTLQATQIAARQCHPAELALGNISCFGPVKQPRVIFIETTGQTQQLAAIHQTLAQALQDVGVAYDRKAFAPHITLARNSRPLPADWYAESAKAANGLPQAPHFRAEELVVMQSELRASGAKYTPVQRIQFGGLT